MKAGTIIAVAAVAAGAAVAYRQVANRIARLEDAAATARDHLESAHRTLDQAGAPRRNGPGIPCTVAGRIGMLIYNLDPDQ